MRNPLSKEQEGIAWYFLLFESLEPARSFREYMPSKHQNKNFSVQHEDIGLLSVLDDKICRENSEFVTI